MKIFESKKKVKTLSKKSQMWLWVGKISVLATSLSLLLSVFSQIILSNLSAILGVVLLVIFLLLNVFSDMIGLAITSCQIDELKLEVADDVLYSRCVKLIRNADKVSSILCDVVGDICGVLCGVCGTLICSKILILSNSAVDVIIGGLTSALICGLTVFLKAISKNYAVNNATKIVRKVTKFLVFFKRKRSRENAKSGIK